MEPLNSTLKELACHPVSKTKFTMIVPEVEERLNALKSSNGIDTVILCGIETHVCILATVIDLRDRGFNVNTLLIFKTFIL